MCDLHGRMAGAAVDLDAALSLAGDCGRYQARLYLLAGAMQFVSVDAFAINLLAAGMPHWCHADNVTTAADQCYLDAAADNRSEAPTPCDRWTYDRSQFTETVVSRVCQGAVCCSASDSRARSIVMSVSACLSVRDCIFGTYTCDLHQIFYKLR